MQLRCLSRLTLSLLTALTAQADRDAVRKRHEDQGLKFLEVFMDVPLAVVQERDPKGLYKKVAAGELKGFSGVDDPYETPKKADLTVDLEKTSVRSAVHQIVLMLESQGLLDRL